MVWEKQRREAPLSRFCCLSVEGFKHRLRVCRLRHNGRLVVNSILNIQMILAQLLQKRDDLRRFPLAENRQLQSEMLVMARQFIFAALSGQDENNHVQGDHRNGPLHPEERRLIYGSSPDEQQDEI